MVEGPSAGRHNAPPRGATAIERSRRTDLWRTRSSRSARSALWEAFLAGGLLWITEKIRNAQRERASGVQMGTPFAFCEESEVAPDANCRVVRRCLEGTLRSHGPAYSPAGFPFSSFNSKALPRPFSGYGARSAIWDIFRKSAKA